MSDEDDLFDDVADEREGDPFDRPAGSGESSDEDDTAFEGADEFIDVHEDAPELEPGTDPFDGAGETDGRDETVDPFGEMDAPDSDADPFEGMDAPDSGVDPFGEMDASDGDADPFGEMDTPDGDADPFSEMDAPDGDTDPFERMGGGEGDADPFGGGESAFESVDVDALDEDELWAAIDGDGDTSTVEQKRYSEVSKHRFCEQCEFFAEPPASHCTHEDAQILEYLDMETVRLVNCPVVAEQRRIENEE